MMTYEIFKDVVIEKIKDYLPEEYKISVSQVNKVNRVMDAINFLPSKGGAAPTIYINDMYEQYVNNNDLQKTLESAANTVEKAMKNVPDILELDFSDASEHVVFQLINTAQNKDMLATVPHREFNDLSIIYRLVFNSDNDGITSTVISNALSKKLGFSEQQLYNMATVNTKRLFPPIIITINDMIKSMMIKDGMDEELVEQMMQSVPADNVMYILTNDRNINGAVSILYVDQLDKLAKMLDSDLYIMPSSIHEVIAVSADSSDPEALAELVSSVNISSVSLEDRLSNEVYLYNRNTKRLNLATDVANKRLDISS